MIGNDMKLDHGVGQPSLLIDKLTVGGTAA